MMEGAMKCLGLATIIFGIAAYASAALAQGYGTISDGSCGCKTRCDGGNAIFSPGRTVDQCRRMCARAFSGCTRGEIRLPGRRDVAGARPQSVARSASVRPAAATTVVAASTGRSTSREQAFDACRRELRGIGWGYGWVERRFNQLEHCVKRKLGNA
jgi:hypothetical protein